MKLRILHLEDNTDDADLVQRSLHRDGLACDVLHVSGQDAYLSALTEPEFDVILSDSGVPGYDGSAAFAAARERAPRVPFIVVSGNPDRQHEHAGGERPHAQIAKSDLKSLAPTIRDVLAQPTPPDSPPSSGAWQLVSVIQRLSLARTLPAIMQIVRDAARSLVSADGATFVLRDGQHCFYADEDAIAPLWKGQRFPLSACISGWTMLNRQPAVIPDIYADARIPLDAYRPTFVKSLVMTPIRSVAPIGAVGVYWARTYQAQPEEIELLRALADSASVAMEAADVLGNLERRVHERTQEVQRRSTELEVLNRELEAFSYSVAHDLRSPLITIDGFSEVLLQSCTQLGETDRGHLERIGHGVRRMHRLINDLLALSKVVRSPMRRTSVDLSKLAHEVAQGLATNAAERAAQFDIANGLVVQADPGLMRIVLDNLLSNAWKFTAKAALARIELGVRADPAGEKAFFVRDNGVGFDPRFAAKLFSPFQRLHAQSQFPGTGVGLATVQRIVHRHGGEVWAESAVDRGACFSFTLPPE